MALVW